MPVSPNANIQNKRNNRRARGPNSPSEVMSDNRQVPSVRNPNRNFKHQAEVQDFVGDNRQSDYIRPTNTSVLPNINHQDKRYSRHENVSSVQDAGHPERHFIRHPRVQGVHREGLNDNYYNYHVTSNDAQWVHPRHCATSSFSSL